jgi:predicted DNA-binding transcriptional regulator AlpA
MERSTLDGQSLQGAQDFRVAFSTLEDCSLITADELASLLGVPLGSIYKRRIVGTLPAPVSIGAQILRWRVGDVRKWLSDLPQATAHTRQRAADVNHRGRPRASRAAEVRD